ncbi:MAG TPA: pentapeptide repeat-containing protein [Pyrinomonadaceae bacterium]
MREKVTHLVKGVKSVTEFLSDAVDAFKDLGFVEAVESALPWAKVAGEATAEALPPLKFFTKIAEELLKETDPEKLGLTACTLAYQKAAETAFKQTGGPAGESQSIAEAKEQLKELANLKEIDMGTFSLESPTRHDFYEHATLCLQVAALKVGYTQAQVDDLTGLVKDNFRHSLTKLLSDGGTKDKFAPFAEYLKLGGPDEKRSRKLLARHANYQRWLFERAPVLRVSPFALKHVYIDTECGQLKWEEINQPQRAQGSRVNPFAEEHGGRRPLLDTVLELIGSKTLSEAIVVQGIAGAGKSSFTLQLCDELLKRRLHPIRVRIKDLSFDKHIKDALPRAVHFGDEDYPEPEPYAFDNLFLNEQIFKDAGVGAYEHVCKYVLILDGWDEISLSDEGFKNKAARMLDQLNEHYLKQKHPRVRVILTGRPSSDLGDTKCLRDETPILTIRKLTPEQLETYVGKLAAAVNAPEPLIEKNEQTETWTVPPLTRFEPIFKKYREAFAQKQQASGELDVLGLPLLTYLTVRLVAEWQGDLSPLLENTTTLYRHLIDLTCREAGKGEVGDADGGDEHKLYGEELRQLLRQTAAAITMSGEENISRKELASRLEMDEDDIDTQASELAKEVKLSSLLISFYFKGGHAHLGCEFAHKSFREYLFAESIVEALKHYGRHQRHTPPPRATFWEDFSENRAEDFRYEFSRRLSELLAPQWLTAEVRKHLQYLIAWEIERTADPNDKKRPGVPTEPLTWEEWAQVRTGLADLWDWWGESGHLRPQPYKEKGITKLRPAYVNELIEWDAPRDARIANWIYARTPRIDAHLGDGLFHLCALVHSHIADNEPEVPQASPRKYQSVRNIGGRLRISFKPSGDDPHRFKHYTSRINSAGWRPAPFPIAEHLRLTDFAGVELGMLNLSGANLSGAHLTRANINRTIFNGARLNGADLSKSHPVGAEFLDADLRDADLSDTYLSNTDLRFADLWGVNLRDANLKYAKLVGAVLEGAFLNLKYLLQSSISAGELERAMFSSIFLDEEKLDRETALQRLREAQEEAKLKGG